MRKPFFCTALILITSICVVPGLRAQDVAPVQVVLPSLGGEAPSYSFTGTISARQRAQLSPRLSGQVLAADLEVGDHFEAGEAILQLDPTLAEIELRLLKADLSLAETERKDAERLLKEANQLGDSGFPRSERLTRDNNLTQADVRLTRAKAALQEQEERVRRHQVLAPFSGIIALKQTEVGEWVETGTPVAELVGDELRLEVRVPQERILVAQNTKTVAIQVQGLPGQTIQGSVEALAPVVEAGSRTFLVRVALENPPPLLKAGMSAVAIFRPTTDDEPLLIPRDAIIRNEAGETLVWTLERSSEDWLARLTPVSLGPSRGSETIVHSGLNETSRVVVRGNEGLRDGEVVRIVGSSSDNKTTTE